MIDKLSVDELKLRARFFYDSIDLYAISDMTGKVIEVNKAMLDTFGYTREEILGATWVDFMHEADLEASSREFAGIMKLGFSKGFMSRIRCKNGEYKLIEWDTNISAETQEIFSLGRDISDSRRAYENLNGQISLQRAIIDSAEFSIISTNVHGIIETFNRCAELMFGYTKKEVIGKMTPLSFFDPHEVEIYAGEIQKNFGKPMEDGIETLLFKPRAGLVEDRGFTLRKRGVITFPAHISISSFSSEQRCFGFLFVARDVTEEKRVAKLKNEFISTVSHELRTPMTSIRGSLGLISGGLAGEMPTEAKPLIEMAISSTDRLIRLVNDILDIEKIDSGKMEFNFKDVEITPLVEQAVIANKSFADKHNVKYRITKSIPNTKIRIDTDRFAQILDNLLSNAAKYTNPGDEIEIELSETPKKVRVSITDHGNGISDTFKPKVFTKFMQANSSDTRKKGGTGLGLATCKALVENQGGTINFTSEEGKGTTFFFEFPLHT